MQIKTFKPKDHKIKALIYGTTGSGKTYFTGTAKKAIFASAEGGLLSIADKIPQFVEVKSLKDLTDLYSYLLNEDHDFETLVIDSITEVNEVIKFEIERRTGHSMQLQDWGELAQQIRTLFRKFRDLPMNVILVALEQYITDEDKIQKIVPSLNGKSATEVTSYMDIVGYLHVDNDGTRWIETGTNKRFLTKDRSGLIGNSTPMDFEEWRRKASSIDTGEQEVSVDYEQHDQGLPPTEEKKPIERAHLKALKTELISRGAKTQEDALKLLSDLLGSPFESLDLTEAEASAALISLLQVQEKKEEPKKITKKVKSNPKK